MELLDALKIPYDRGDRSWYYRTLINYGDPYGKLALGVVEQSLFSGRVARHFAEFITSEWWFGQELDNNKWLGISYALMTADYNARLNPTAKDQTNNLYWTTIRDYHAKVFRDHHITELAWTAFIPLELAGASKGAQLWSDMLRSGIIPSSYETVMSLIPAFAQRARMPLLPPAEDQTGIINFANSMNLLIAGVTLDTIRSGGHLVSSKINANLLEKCRSPVQEAKKQLEAMRCATTSPQVEKALLWLEAIAFHTGPEAAVDETFGSVGSTLFPPAY
ncbi:hypothetical protein [Swingsia samuiensis]|uniref:Uncharacterized protein n=1 Tax=Swingsia samuiensis TaxID=1293412 RepID=A0A4Y6UKN8_9PROT|nr:hypothetical protein [Swingsia samuiensis]QDH16585.1 hypothetical protein E3D00_02610 [Swingsia samuiensis]